MKFRNLIAFLLILLCGCIGPDGVSSYHAAAEQAPEDFALGHQMIAAMKEQDYPCFVRDFSRELKESTSEAAFRKLCKDLAGRQETIDSWKLLETLDRGGLYQTEVWKITFLRDNGREKVRMERLFFVTKAKLDGRIVVIGFRGDPLF